MGFREEICNISCVLISYSNIGPFIECHIKIFKFFLFKKKLEYRQYLITKTQGGCTRFEVEHNWLKTTIIR